MHPKTEKKVFDTMDVVALYLGKTFDLKQMPKVKEIVEFLTGSNENFSYNDTPRLLPIQQTLAKQLPWLGSLRYNRENFENWKKNIIRNHDSQLELKK